MRNFLRESDPCICVLLRHLLFNLQHRTDLREWAASCSVCFVTQLVYIPDNECWGQRRTFRHKVIQSCDFSCDLRLFVTFRHSAVIAHCVRKVAHFARRTVLCGREEMKMSRNELRFMVTSLPSSHAPKIWRHFELQNLNWRAMYSRVLLARSGMQVLLKSAVAGFHAKPKPWAVLYCPQRNPVHSVSVRSHWDFFFG